MRWKIAFIACLVVMLLIAVTLPIGAQDQINYISQPDELTVFLNDVVFVRDDLRVPLDVETRIVLPGQIIQDTLILSDENGRLPLYSMSYQNGQYILTIRGDEGQTASTGVRNLTLEYITLGGIHWQPLYDLHLALDTPDEVGFNFFAAIQNDSFALESTRINLVAGQVNVSGQIPLPSFFDTNQGFSDSLATATPAGMYAPPSANVSPGSSTVSTNGAVTTQFVYKLEPLSSQPGETLYAELLETNFPARRVLLWNAYVDAQGSVVYKVRNNSTIALTEGIVRSYQDGLFTGSDEIEYTPPGAEGSVTVGPLRDVSVRREITRTSVTAQNPNDSDGIEVQNDVTLTLTNLTAEEQEIEVVDTYPQEAFALAFSGPEPERRGGNILRWLLTLPTDEGIKITYSYRTPY